MSSAFRKFARANLLGFAPTVLVVLMAGSALAQDDVEPPALVGRISVVHGEVSMLRADETDWSQATINQPVTVGDAVYTANDGDARLQIGAADISLKGDTEVDIASLDDNSGRIRLDSGIISFRVAELPTADGLSIMTPRGTVLLTQPGTYRIDAGTEDLPTQVTAWTGGAQLGDSGTAVNITPGQTLLINGTADAPEYSYAGNIGEPPAEWRTPPRIVAIPEAERYVPPEMTGAEDLYDYGAFERAPDYGAVWYPRSVPVNWQPYRYGHWQYVRPWGQTWIDDQPWGFAPFHYGRWAYIGHRWGWVPGPYQRRPVYAPALVAFVGGGGIGASISIGIGGGGGIGWVPLAPGEGYRPPYRASPTYIRNINRTVVVNNVTVNNTVINNNGRRPGQPPETVAGLANRRFATVVPTNVMSGSRPVAGAAVAVRPDALDKAKVNQDVVHQIKPVPAAQRPGARPGPVAQPPRGRPNLNQRPALPPANSRPGGPNAGPNAGQARPGQARPDQPGAPQPGVKPDNKPGTPNMPGGPNARPGRDVSPPNTRPAQPAVPNAQQPGAERPNVRPGPNQPPTPPNGRRPEVRPDATPEAAKPGPGRQPDDRQPGVQRPGARPGPATPAEQPATPPPRPEVLRPGRQNPDNGPAATPRPARPAPMPQQPEAAPRPAPQPQVPRPQPQPRPEAQPQPRPQPQPQMRPQPQQQPQPRPQPQAQPPRPQPQPQQARPQPQPQQQRPQPQQQQQQQQRNKKDQNNN
jgi:hypothetical protein